MGVVLAIAFGFQMWYGINLHTIKQRGEESLHLIFVHSFSKGTAMSLFEHYPLLFCLVQIKFLPFPSLGFASQFIDSTEPMGIGLRVCYRNLLLYGMVIVVLPPQLLYRSLAEHWIFIVMYKYAGLHIKLIEIFLQQWKNNTSNHFPFAIAVFMLWWTQWCAQIAIEVR